MKVLRVDHIGINVQDLEAAKAFFIDLGFVLAGEMTMEGELVERVIGLTDVRDDMAMLQAPDGNINLELVKFHHPLDKDGVQEVAANTLGLRHLCFEVDDLEETVATLRERGHKLVGEIQTYEDMWKLCYIRGPEAIIIELAEKLSPR